eukprot:scaffold28821_cov63-Phaeocystis_antarctica.AAC.3
MAASVVTPSFPMPLLPRLRARGRMETVREQACQWALRRGPSDTPESVHRGRGRQHETEQLCRDDAKAGTVEVQAADCIVLPQPLHRNPAHRPTRCAGHSCEQQLVWWLPLALVNAAAQGRMTKGAVWARSAQCSLLYPLGPIQLDREAITAKPRQVGHRTHRSDCLARELLDV